MKPTIAALTLLLFVGVAIVQRTVPPSKAELAQITERGRHLAQYDVAVWYASDAVVATKPTEGAVARYIAKKDGDTWTVMFGRLNEQRDRFLIAYEATQGTSPKEFTVKKNDPPKEDTGFFLFSDLTWQAKRLRCKGALCLFKSTIMFRLRLLPIKNSRVVIWGGLVFLRWFLF